MSAAPDLAADRRLLQDTLRAAGALAVKHFRAARGHWYKGPGQVVTAADLEVDRLLRERLLSARPDDGWLSEETADDGSRLARPRVWIVDPIDGTRAFADGLPEFAISIALLVENEPVLGGILNPATGELFEAVRGEGATLDGAPLRPSRRTSLEGARLLSARTEMKRRRWPALLPEAEFAAVSSLAYKLALVAAGRHDGLVSLRRSHDWDLAAAALMISEVGACLTDAGGNPLRLNRSPPQHSGLVAAGNPVLHGSLVRRLARVQDAPGA